MPTVYLNKEEREILLSIPLNSITYWKYQKVVYHLNLLLDKETGEVEIPGGLWDDMRWCAFNARNPLWQQQMVSVFGRTLGPWLDQGFFDKKE